jgi:transposase
VHKVHRQVWWRSLEVDIATVTKEIEAIAVADKGRRRLLAIPCVGPLVATALVAAMADGSGFKRGRDLAAWLGLVPRQHSTGGKSTLLGMSKRGNSHLRRLFIHGARSASMHMKRDQGLGPWLDQLDMRPHKNVSVVALANKIVSISWAVQLGGARPAGAVSAADADYRLTPGTRTKRSAAEE